MVLHGHGFTGRQQPRPPEEHPPFPRSAPPRPAVPEYLAPKYSDARAAFDRYDKDHDHTLSKAECVAFVRGTGLAVTEQYIEGVWSV